MLVTMSEILKDAQERHYAVGLFNTIDTDMLDAAIRAAEELRSPIIVGTAEVLLPYGELDLIGPAMLAAARKASVPVAVHFDHGLTKARCLQALELGFTGIMFDGSAGSAAENIAQTAEIVEIAHRYGVSVEGEIGHVGETVNGDEAETDGYTTPKQAADFIARTGVDALAVAIGTAHGTYKQAPRLDIQRLREIRSAVDTPLVLHGGSGLTEQDFQNTIREGIAKINIYTDLCDAGYRGMQEGLSRKLSYADVRNQKVAAAQQTVMEKIRLFGSEEKA